ncbi:glycosyltransferase family 39 protein [Candidatus Woesearchaeota archaeon]|nr:glycosyltransferase family 39 protein [Candidatus Woesearchaeota archaeon]
MQEGEVDKIEERKAKIKKIIYEKINILQYLFLAVIIWLGIYIRKQPLSKLIDFTTNEYISLELDSTLFLRYAEYIAEHGSLFSIDTMRYYPFGASLGGIGTFTSYFVAYLYKFLNLIGFNVSVAYVDVIYPIVSMAILSIFFFLLVRRLFDWRVALLSTLIINVIPTFLFRSLGGSSDHDILALMLVVMAFYFFFTALQTKELKYSIPLAFVLSIITMLAVITAGTSSFISLIFGLFIIIEILLNKFDKKDYYVYLTWFLPIVLWFIYRSGFKGITSLANSTAAGFALFGLIFATVYFLLNDTTLFKKYTEKINLPSGILSLLVAVVLSLVLSLIFLGPSFFTNKIDQFYNQLFKTYANTRWTLTVAENHRPYVTDWFGQLGKVFVFSFILGSILLFYDLVKPLKKNLWLTGAYAIFIFGYVFSRYSPSSVLNGANTIPYAIFYGSLIGFVGLIIYLYLWSYYKNKEAFNSITKFDKKYTFVFVWFLIMIFAATAAVRLLFEFSPVISIVGSFFIISLVDYSFKLKNKIFGFGALIIIAILLINPFSYAQGFLITYYNSSKGQASGIGPSYDFQWQNAGKWVRENTPKESVFAHWWDYGYWVQSGFQRATVTDGGNFHGWWNYLMGRLVLTGQTEEEGLSYLYAHNVSHLLMVSDEIGKYPAYSSIGSDLNYDRFSSIPAFTLDMADSRETRDGLDAVYKGGAGLDQNIIYNNQLLPAGSTGIAGFIIPMKNINGSLEITRPNGVFVYQGKQVNIPINCVYFNDVVMNFGKDGYDGCLRMIPSIQNNQVNGIGGLLLLSPKVKNSLFSQLYLMNKKSRYYELVYDDSDKVPLAFFGGRVIGPIRIWKLNYPSGFKINSSDYEYYTRYDYPDARLMNP